jgi:DNA-binding CsgD family transcriptional regulator
MMKNFCAGLHRVMDFDKSLYHYYDGKADGRYFGFGSPDLTEEQLESYSSTYVNLDFCTWYALQPETRAFRDTMVLPPDEIVKTSFYKGWLKPMNLLYGVAATIACRGIAYGTMGCFRSYEKGDYTDEDIELIQMLDKQVSLRLYNLFPNGIQAGDFSDTASSLRRKYHLTDKEEEIVNAIAKGTAKRELPGRLFIADSTLKKHLMHIYEKMNVNHFSDLEFLILKEKGEGTR